MTEAVAEKLPALKPHKMEIVWRNVILMGSLHLTSVYGLYLVFVVLQWKTVLAGETRLFSG